MPNFFERMVPDYLMQGFRNPVAASEEQNLFYKNLMPPGQFNIMTMDPIYHLAAGYTRNPIYGMGSSLGAHFGSNIGRAVGGYGFRNAGKRNWYGSIGQLAGIIGGFGLSHYLASLPQNPQIAPVQAPPQQPVDFRIAPQIPPPLRRDYLNGLVNLHQD